MSSLAASVVAAPVATGDIVYTPIPNQTYEFGIGLYDPSNPNMLNSVYVTSGNQPAGSPRPAWVSMSCFTRRLMSSKIPVLPGKTMACTLSRYPRIRPSGTIGHRPARRRAASIVRMQNAAPDPPAHESLS